jgi:hypothetical protein
MRNFLDSMVVDEISWFVALLNQWGAEVPSGSSWMVQKRCIGYSLMREAHGSDLGRLKKSLGWCCRNAKIDTDYYSTIVPFEGVVVLTTRPRR